MEGGIWSSITSLSVSLFPSALRSGHKLAVFAFSACTLPSLALVRVCISPSFLSRSSGFSVFAQRWIADPKEAMRLVQTERRENPELRLRCAVRTELAKEN
mmetsp:Transcript_46154/g.90972  ORF Transcript_46154/g.90972 Transcript_46154/m.90972 type:complete len:101 (+) Transcript_46154:163-465(+)